MSSKFSKSIICTGENTLNEADSFRIALSSRIRDEERKIPRVVHVVIPFAIEERTNERISAEVTEEEFIETWPNDHRLNVTRDVSDTREGIQSGRLQAGASMRSTDPTPAGTRDRVYAADKRCTRARVITVKHVDDAFCAVLASFSSTNSVLPLPPSLPPSFSSLLPLVLGDDSGETDSFVRIKSESLSSPFHWPTCFPLTTIPPLPCQPSPFCQRVRPTLPPFLQPRDSFLHSEEERSYIHPPVISLENCPRSR